MKSADIRKLSNDEITKKLDETRKEYMLMRFQAVSGQLTDTSKIMKIKRLIALIEPENEASEMVARKIGMIFEKEVVRQGGVKRKVYVIEAEDQGSAA